jgi:serine/threonine-protein kinase
VERTDTGRAGTASADPLIGRVLDGRYRVGPRVARGGMATVYEATDLRLDRTVALKVMHAGLVDDEDFVARFEREARSAARLAHHNAVAVFDQGEDGNTLFLVMEYVPGLTLRDLIRKEAPLAPGHALSLLEPVLSALAAAHGAGVIHRDVKPENVLIADDGRIKVADFGLARAVNAETQHTATGGVLIGTVSYLAPELVVDGKADARADVYAAGVILYELLTGAKPHQAESPIQVAYKHVHEDVPPPSEVVRGIPSYVDALVARATARNPQMRPADAKVLLHQLRRVRQALDHGITDDPELTADLAPTGELPTTGGADEPTTRVLTPVTPAAAAGAADLGVDVGADLDTGLDTVDPDLDPDLDTDHTMAVPAFVTEDARDRKPVRVTPQRQPGEPRPPRSGNQRVPGVGRSRRGPVLLVGLLVAALVLGLGAYWFGIARYTHTPGVINLSAAAAEKKIEAAGLTFKISGRAHSETYPRGTVMDTDPDAGSRVLKDGTVSAVISRGPERFKVPNAVGKSLNKAQDLLLARHLEFGGSTEKFSEKVAKGRIISMSPKPGTPLKRDSAVSVVVSKGPRPIKVPDFTGKDAEKATAELEELGFEVSTSQEHSDSVKEGRVISQDPDSGTLFKGDSVALVVSQGPEMVEVPRVRGRRVGMAKKLLEEAGFKVKVKRSDIYIGAGYVVGSDPEELSDAPEGSTITITVV